MSISGNHVERAIGSISEGSINECSNNKYSQSQRSNSDVATVKVAAEKAVTVKIGAVNVAAEIGTAVTAATRGAGKAQTSITPLTPAVSSKYRNCSNEDN